MPQDCIICGAANSTCGMRTAHKTIAVDQPIRGTIIGDTIVPDVTQLQGVLGDMTQDEREEFEVMSEAYARRRARFRRENMADQKTPHTYLVYVTDPPDPINKDVQITRKMTADQAEAYVKLNPGAEITRRGDLDQPVPERGEIIGATKARVGEVFDADGTQKVGIQPLTTRTYGVADRTSEAVLNPPVGAPVELTPPSEPPKAEPPKAQRPKAD